MLTNNRIYRLLPAQIPFFWDVIKYCCEKADEVDKEDMPSYFSELLQALLSEKAQCFIVLTEEKRLVQIGITRVIVDKVIGSKHLFGQCMYSWDRLSEEDLTRFYSFLLEFAEKEKCTAFTFNSRNPRMWELAKMARCTEKHRTFIYKIRR